MYDWTDDFYLQAKLSFPYLFSYIEACQRNGDADKLMSLLLSLEKDNQPIQ